MWYENIGEFDEENPDILEYAKAIITTCDYWIESHRSKKTYIEWEKERLNRDGGFDAWIGLGDFFDIEPLLLRRRAKEMVLVDCKECGVVEDCYHSRARKLPLREKIDWLLGCYGSTLDYSNQDVEWALGKAYTAFRANIRWATEGVDSDIRQLRRDLKRKKPTLSLLAWANHVSHYSGYLLYDYGEYAGLSYKVIDKISQEGLESIFPPEQLARLKE